ncbi:MAG: hypothetical protein RJA07_833 [Bacteroidota bacterium]|jgi:hypothetical protein
MKNLFLLFILLLLISILKAAPSDTTKHKNKPTFFSSIGVATDRVYTYPVGEADKGRITSCYSIFGSKKISKRFSLLLNFRKEQLENSTNNSTVVYSYKIISLSPEAKYSFIVRGKFYWDIGIGINYNSIYKDYEIRTISTPQTKEEIKLIYYNDAFLSMSFSSSLNYMVNKKVSISLGARECFALTTIRPYHPNYDWYKLYLKYIGLNIGVNYRFKNN